MITVIISIIATLILFCYNLNEPTYLCVLLGCFFGIIVGLIVGHIIPVSKQVNEVGYVLDLFDEDDPILMDMSYESPSFEFFIINPDLSKQRMQIDVSETTVKYVKSNPMLIERVTTKKKRLLNLFSLRDIDSVEYELRITRETTIKPLF